ncbi:uncharacterized protein LOC123825151 [Phyllostomus hastatus]|uniref:uncharacterized protein LOC123825151 n=1 Tax=Phyllostomus hastatus TaxID=9423 RepID=UPI001E685C4E|nr:uncharacterized protein LOC123825151 [Phyllostomus hastatus]
MNSRFSEKPRPGDIIEISNSDCKDWAIYVGDGHVIHLTPPRLFSRIGSSNIFAFQTGKARVTEEPLESAAWFGMYRVNNHLDNKCRPRPVDDIISSAREMIHSLKTPLFLLNTSKSFVTYLRYGWPCREFSREDPMPGDLIEIHRTNWMRSYEHWAIYVGDSYVVHLGSPDQYSWPHSSNNSGHEVKAVVKYEPLKDVANNDSYKVNNYLDRRFRPCPVDDIVKLAMQKIGEIRSYNVFKSNCEHFVTELRNGHSHSEQAENIDTLSMITLSLALSMSRAPSASA